MKEVVDIVIVGSGASGAAAAWSLSRNRSLRIVCLEQGSVTRPSEYPSTSVDWDCACRCVHIQSGDPREFL